ncbi:MAG: NAD-dependent epimerase/dehydratase family protein, partial [Anaerolineae bacterium]|nr:NAD-dependent epimerase/dehydratase family protein [Anaerolineae bacterium]
ANLYIKLSSQWSYRIDWKGNMILVTGGTGFLGRNLMPALVKAGYRVRALVRQPEQADWLGALGVEMVRGSTEDVEAVNRAMEGCRYVVHAAGRFRFWGRWEQFERTNVLGTQNVLVAAWDQKVEKVVHISTVVVVGAPIPGRVIDEKHPLNPQDPYQHSKLRGERQALTYYENYDLPVVVLRPGGFYGPWGRYAFNRLFFDDPLNGNLVQINHGRFHTLPVYIGDVVQGIMLGLEKGRPGEIYNICGECPTHKEANDIISEQAGITEWRINVPMWMLVALASAWTRLSYIINREPYYSINMRSYVMNDWVVSSEKARRELGFVPTPFAEGVRRTLAWYSEQGLMRPSWRRPLSLLHKLPLPRRA